ncbi:nuclear transport factor 2 family protein [Kibdelosporangium philippinense]|uniref:Nuclear transport factor 2 family protein n=1 Tax=Kibdelosporangium philippinense TaxID=211113 RepID=A0ABS8Z3B6_9PSEU|nr:nuclear transport factor 2 family protein [Kibdelosporangium philippinense]MCE7001852.1 nuclear transport factor 2 family protein [Kibdelosporangium philippinense]
MTPREAFEKMRDFWLTGTEHYIWAPDLVVETPFGVTKRIRGAENFREIARAGRAALPVTLTECTTIAIHDTIEPDVIVVEYELAGIVNATGERHSARFIGVLTVRNGKVVHWREYQDTARMAAAGVG